MPKPKRKPSDLKKPKVNKGPLIDEKKSRLRLNPIDVLDRNVLFQLQDLIDDNAVVEKMTIVPREHEDVENHLIPCKMRLGKYVFDWGFRSTPTAFPDTPETGNDWIDGAKWWIVTEELKNQAKGDRSIDTWGDILDHICALLGDKSREEISNALYSLILKKGSDIVNVSEVELIAVTQSMRPVYEITIKYHFNAKVFDLDVSEHVFDLTFSVPHEHVATDINPRFILKNR